MNIDKLIENLENTIAGKKMYLSRIEVWRKRKDEHQSMDEMLHQVVSMNIEELERILVDARMVKNNS